MFFGSPPFTARPKSIARSTAALFATGSTPGNAISTAFAWVLGGAPNAVEPPENIFGRGRELRVGFQPDDDFPAHCSPAGSRRCQSVAFWYWCATLRSLASAK